MAYPGGTLPSTFYYISNNVEAASPTNKKFIAFTCTTAGTVTFKAADSGSSLFEINAAGEVYETVGANGVSIPLLPGVTIYGAFSSITSDGTAKGVAYVG